MTLDGILEHQRAFQNIAIANGGNRAATTPGYDASVEYVTNRLRAAGYRVTHDEFDFPMWRQNGPATLSEVSPTARTFTEGTDYIVDYGPFIANGVPAGRLFTGAEQPKTQRQQEVYGGFAGMPFDPNYHEDGDTFFNLSYTALDQMSDAAAHGAWTLAESRSDVTDARAAKVKRGKKGSWKYRGPFRLR